MEQFEWQRLIWVSGALVALTMLRLLLGGERVDRLMKFLDRLFYERILLFIAIAVTVILLVALVTGSWKRG